MQIKKIDFFQVHIPLKFLFTTAKKSINYREVLIIKVTDKDGVVGFGEVVAFQEPFYTKETLESAKKILKNIYIPKVLETTLDHPFDIHSLFDVVSPMAMAGLENALLDVWAKKQNKNIITELFQEELANTVGLGIVLGDMPLTALFNKIDIHIKEGCQRFKIKIKPQDGFEKIEKLTIAYPHIQFLADANKSYSLEEVDKILQFDVLEKPLLCIEEPFAITDLGAYKNILLLQKTPICFDESILTLEDLEYAYSLGILQMLNVKIGRLGGLYYTQKAIEFCRKKRIPFWIGSMVESGISKILHVQLAGLQGVCMAGDLSDSRRYFEKDLIIPEITFTDGFAPVPKETGLGVVVDEKAIKEYCVESWHYK